VHFTCLTTHHILFGQNIYHDLQILPFFSFVNIKRFMLKATSDFWDLAFSIQSQPIFQLGMSKHLCIELLCNDNSIMYTAFGMPFANHLVFYDNVLNMTFTVL